MRIVIATAEPRGAYHLTPLAAVMAESSDAFVHLVPYSELVQGVPATEVSSRLAVIDTCDRVVLTGGTLSAWTELVCQYATSHHKPVIFTQLANLDNTAPVTPLASITLATALSSDGANSVSSYLRTPDVIVTGTPALDGLPAWNPVPKRALLLSTSDMTHRDPTLELRVTADALRRHGWDVRIRTHPREDRAPWGSFTVVDGTQAESAASAQVVIGYPGSAHVLAAAVGVPVISLAPNFALASVFTERQAAVMSAHVRSTVEVLDLIDSVRTPDPLLVEAVVGPIGGASRRVIDLWTGSLPSKATAIACVSSA
jgi:hypothetical protein